MALDPLPHFVCRDVDEGLALPLQSPLNAILHACLNSYLQYYKDKKIILRTLTVSFSIMLSFSEIR